MANSKTILRGSSNYKPWQRTTLSINPTPSVMSKPVANQNSYDARFPWLNETSYRKMESEVNKMGLSWTEREDAMNDWYRNNVTYLLNDQTLQERDTYLNEQAYQAANLQDPQAYAQYRMEDAVQKAKKLWNLDATANDLDVFADIVGSLPNGNQLAWEYLSWQNKDLLYEAWILEKIEAPETPEPTVWGMQSIINKQSEIPTDSALGKVNAALDWTNFPGKVTEFVDWLVQKIPVVDGKRQVQNLVNKMNNLSDEEMQGLYDRYVEMIRNWTDEKWKNDDRDGWALFWDAMTWDKDALDRVNTLHLYDYSGIADQNGIQRNKRGNQIWNNVSNWASLEEINQAIDDKWMNKVASGLAKASVWTADKMKNILNLVWGAYGTLQNYAEALWVGMQQLDDIRDNRFASTEWLETDENAFMEYVADKTANFGEYMLDAPDTLMWKPVTPNAVKFLSNIPWSFLKTLSAQIRGKTNQLDTKIWLAKILFTEEWQEALLNRYGTTDALANAINTDPVWVADDMLDFADKFNLVLNKTTWGAVEREQIWSLMDGLSSNAVNDLNIGMTKVSNWLWDNWYKRTANLINLERDTATNPWNISKDAKDIAYQWAEDLWAATRYIYDAAWNIVWTMKDVANDAAFKAGQIARNVADVPEWVQSWARRQADQKIQNLNRMTKGQQEKFVEMSWGEDQWTFQNKRNLKTTQDMADHLTKNLKQVDDAMDTIEGRFTSPQLDVVMEDVLKYATDTEDPNLSRMQELSRKNAEWWLEMKEINEVKRYYERTNIFDYLKEWKSKKARKSTNRDSALREWQYKIAEDSWLDNLKDLNQETRLTKFLLDNATDWQNGVKWNNGITLTDWIVASWWWLDASGIAALVGKKVYQSNRFQEKLVDVYNFIWNRQYEAWPTVDMDKIRQKNQERAELAELDKIALAEELAKVQTEKQFNEWLQKAEYMAWPALPQYDTQNYNTIIWSDRNTISVTPWWQSVRQWQIADVGFNESQASSKTVNNLKAQQLQIIQDTNPALDDIHTRIRKESDIKTYPEAIKEYGTIEDLTPDFTKDMVQRALDEGEITVYSSYPIKNWYWVTPSKMEAQAYAWWGKVYSKTVKLDDVAWVDELQWQYAKI